MDAYRFYVADLREQMGTGVGTVRLPAEEAHHARSVLRLSEGERVVVFDGAGRWAAGVIAKGHGKKDLGVKVAGEAQVDPVPGIRLTIATAAPKGDRAQWLVEQASQLYVWKLQWLGCDRGVVKPREGGGKIEKWRRLAVESAKQCGRTHVMAVEDVMALEEALREAAGKKVLWLDPHGGKAIGGVIGPDFSGEIVALVGPEGGWSEREMGMLEGEAGMGRVVRVRLTETVLRIETACAAIGAIVMSGR